LNGKGKKEDSKKKSRKGKAGKTERAGPHIQNSKGKGQGKQNIGPGSSLRTVVLKKSKKSKKETREVRGAYPIGCTGKPMGQRKNNCLHLGGKREKRSIKMSGRPTRGDWNGGSGMKE